MRKFDEKVLRRSSVNQLGTKSSTSSSAVSPVESGFQIGDSVSVVNAVGLRKIGIVKFSGPVHFSTGAWVGIELPDASGKTDGLVQGTRYFTCKPKFGMLVRSTLCTKPKDGQIRSRPTSMNFDGKLPSGPSSVSDDTDNCSIGGDFEENVGRFVPELSSLTSTSRDYTETIGAGTAAELRGASPSMSMTVDGSATNSVEPSPLSKLSPLSTSAEAGSVVTSAAPSPTKIERSVPDTSAYCIAQEETRKINVHGIADEIAGDQETPTHETTGDKDFNLPLRVPSRKYGAERGVASAVKPRSLLLATGDEDSTSSMSLKRDLPHHHPHGTTLASLSAARSAKDEMLDKIDSLLASANVSPKSTYSSNGGFTRPPSIQQYNNSSSILRASSHDWADEQYNTSQYQHTSSNGIYSERPSSYRQPNGMRITQPIDGKETLTSQFSETLIESLFGNKVFLEKLLQTAVSTQKGQENQKQQQQQEQEKQQEINKNLLQQIQALQGQLSAVSEKMEKISEGIVGIQGKVEKVISDNSVGSSGSSSGGSPGSSTNESCQTDDVQSIPVSDADNTNVVINSSDRDIESIDLLKKKDSEIADLRFALQSVLALTRQARESASATTTHPLGSPEIDSKQQLQEQQTSPLLQQQTDVLLHDDVENSENHTDNIVAEEVLQ